MAEALIHQSAATAGRSNASSGGMSDSVSSFFGERYQAELELSRSLRAVTWRGRDAATGDVVAIKAIRGDALNEATLLRLEHDAGLLQRLEIKSLRPILDWGRTEEYFYVVSPYIDGETLRDRLERGALSLEETTAVGESLLLALCAAHDVGVLHRDVVPSNVIVSLGSPVVGATLIDMGMTFGDLLADDRRDDAAETARYISPELAGLLHYGISEGTDLYSVGLILYECLLGKPAFAGESVNEILLQQVTVQPASLRSGGLATPRALDELVQRLIQKDPRQRYQTSEAALHDLRFIANELRRGERQPALVVGLYDRRRTLADSAFVGRQRELEELESWMESARAGTPTFTLLEAEAGLGKTRLLDELERAANERGFSAWRTQAATQSVQRPLATIETLAEQIVDRAARDTGLRERILARLSDHASVLAAVLPTLATIEGWPATGEAGPEPFGENRTLAALTAMLEALGESGHPALVVIDDGQWGDDLTLKIVAQWERRCHDDEIPAHTMALVAFRSEETSLDHPLRRLTARSRMELRPLGDSAIRQIAESMAGQLPDLALNTITRLAAGSPFMASAILRGMVESGALIFNDDAWEVRSDAMRDISSSAHAGEFLTRRLDMLPPDTRRLLTIAAIIGKQFELTILTGLGRRLGVQEVMGALQTAQHRHLIWSRPNGIHLVFVHDRIREALLSELTVVQRAELFLNAATYLEEYQPQRVFDLAYFFDAAGETARAFPYAMLAADQARQQHSLELAEQQYQIAARGLEQQPAGVQFHVYEGWGEVLMLRGRYDAAEVCLRNAKSLAFDRATAAGIGGKLGELAFKRGDMCAACTALEEAIRSLRRKVPTNHVMLALRLGVELARQTLHTLFPRWLVGRRRRPPSEEHRLAMRLYSRLGYAYWFERGGLYSLWAHLAGMNLAELYPPSAELGQSYSEHAVAISLAPWWLRRGVRYAEFSLQIRQDRGDRWGEGQSLSFHGALLYSASQFAESIDKCARSIQLLERTGDLWERNISRYHTAACRYRLGDVTQAAAETQRVLASGRQLGDAQAVAISLDLWAKVSPEEVSGEEIEQELLKPQSDVQGHAHLLQGLGAKRFDDGDFARAADAFRLASEICREAGIRNVWTAPILPWLASSLRCQAEQTMTLTPFERRRLWREAAAAASRGARIARVFQNDLPHALREAARCAAAAGRVKRARRWLDKSIAVAEAQGARRELALSLAVRGQMRIETGDERGTDDLIRAKEVQQSTTRNGRLFNEVGSPTERAEPTLSLADRFHTVLDAGRRIATGLNHDRIFHEVTVAARRLLRAEECVALPVSEGRIVEPADGVDARRRIGPSEQLLQDALKAGRSITMDRVASAVTSDEVGRRSGSSELCAPIVVNDEIVACLYAMHGQLRGLFGDEEERLADFIVTLAGAALENADNYEELERLNTTLETRVRERTADAEARASELARSNEELEQFAYVVSHDMQEPLRTIASFCQLLERRYGDRLDDRGREFIHYATDGADRMRKIITDLLSYSRVSTRGKAFEPVDCQRLLERVQFNLQIAIEESGAVISCAELPVIMGDDSQLLQLFQNLIANAIKFRGSDPPRIQVGVERTGNEWVFSIRDNGIGIAPQYFDRIFLVFQRLHTKGEFEGTGIGLAVCKKTVERHGGRIWVESSPGRGSTFSFSIPHRDTRPRSGDKPSAFVADSSAAHDDANNNANNNANESENDNTNESANDDADRPIDSI